MGKKQLMLKRDAYVGRFSTRYYEACRAVPALAPRGSESATDKRPL